MGQQQPQVRDWPLFKTSYNRQRIQYVHSQVKILLGQIM